MTQRVVKLKPDKTPSGPAIRVRRADSGFGFYVGAIAQDGSEDIRSVSEHSDYDVALKEARERAHRIRLPVVDATGVEPEEAPAAKSAQRPARAALSKRSAATIAPAETTDDLPALASLFRLPELAERFGEAEAELVTKRSAALNREARDRFLAIHGQVYGESRNHTVAYSQRTHDQIQGQIAGLYDHCLTIQALLYGYLEAAFDRIAALESGPKGLNYREIYRAGETYEPQDCVTYGGSVWVARKTTSEKPGESESEDRPWVLAVRKGRDGKASKEGHA